MLRMTLDTIAELARKGRIDWALACAFHEARQGRDMQAGDFLREWMSLEYQFRESIRGAA